MLIKHYELAAGAGLIFKCFGVDGQKRGFLKTPPC